MVVKEVDPQEALQSFLAQYATRGDAASALSCSQQHLSDLLRGNRTFSPRLLKKLGLKLSVVKA